MKHKNYFSKTCALLLFFVCAAAATSVYAQDVQDSQKIGIGVKAAGIYGVVDFNARFWTASKFGFEAGYGQRYGIKEIPVSALYTITHIDTDSVYIRPYVGGGIGIYSYPEGVSILGWSSNDWQKCIVDGECDFSSSTKIGGQGFGGAEFTFKSFPRLSLGAEIGHWRVGYGGHETAARFNVHFYVK